MVDTGRPSSCRAGEGLGLELVWGQVIEECASTFTIVEHLSLEVHSPLRLLSGQIGVTAYQFSFRRTARAIRTRPFLFARPPIELSGSSAVWVARPRGRASCRDLRRRHTGRHRLRPGTTCRARRAERGCRSHRADARTSAGVGKGCGLRAWAGHQIHPGRHRQAAGPVRHRGHAESALAHAVEDFGFVSR